MESEYQESIISKSIKSFPQEYSYQQLQTIKACLSRNNKHKLHISTRMRSE